MKTLEQKIEVMQAALDGRDIEWAYKEGCWNPHEGEAAFNWVDHDYRIKPEPREFWIALDMGGGFVSCEATQSNAENRLRNYGSGTITKVREVTE